MGEARAQSLHAGHAMRSRKCQSKGSLMPGNHRRAATQPLACTHSLEVTRRSEREAQEARG